MSERPGRASFRCRNEGAVLQARGELDRDARRYGLCRCRGFHLRIDLAPHATLDRRNFRINERRLIITDVKRETVTGFICLRGRECDAEREAHLSSRHVDRTRDRQPPDNNGGNAHVNLHDLIGFDRVGATKMKHALHARLHASAAGMPFNRDFAQFVIAAQTVAYDAEIDRIGISARKTVRTFENVGWPENPLATRSAAATPFSAALAAWIRLTVEPDS